MGSIEIISEINPQDEINPRDLQQIAKELEDKDPLDVVKWGIENFRGGITLACSFGAEDVALVDMVARIDLSVPVFYLDTDYLFEETLEVRNRIIARYGIKPIAVRPKLTIDEQTDMYGSDLFASRPDLCCRIRKVQPLREQLGNYRAWITGIRRDQAPTRANAGLVEWDAIFNMVKLNPLAPWSSSDVWEYIRAHDVPYNALHDKNYPSIGCHPCTRQVQPGEDPRAGRWENFSKKECGLHTETGPAD
ncbi:MAG: phosphoadenylyl-sulfate reductase [Acidobacteriota bacterium]